MSLSKLGLPGIMLFLLLVTLVSVASAPQSVHSDSAVTGNCALVASFTLSSDQFSQSITVAPNGKVQYGPSWYRNDTSTTQIVYVTTDSELGSLLDEPKTLYIPNIYGDGNAAVPVELFSCN